jgi:hypothetical protein
VEYAPGRLGRAFSLGKNSPEISFGTRLIVDLNFESSTLAAWIKPAQISTAMTLFERTGRFGFRWWITEEGRPAFCFDDEDSGRCASRTVVSTRPVAPEQWQLVSVVRNADSLTLYIGSEAVASQSVKIASLDRLSEAGRIARLGSSGEGRARFLGLMDEVALFRRALSPADLATFATVTTLSLPAPSSSSR